MAFYTKKRSLVRTTRFWNKHESYDGRHNVQQRNTAEMSYKKI